MYTGGIKRLDGDKVRIRAEAPSPPLHSERSKRMKKGE